MSMLGRKKRSMLPLVFLAWGSILVLLLGLHLTLNRPRVKQERSKLQVGHLPVT